MGKAINDTNIGQGLKNNEPELLEPTLLCDNKGNLKASSIGWSRQPMCTCNLSGHWLRKKKWNYWNIVSDKYLFCIAVADFDYAAMAFTYLYDLKINVLNEKTFVVPFARDCEMSESVKGNVHFRNKEMNLSFKEEKGCTIISVKCDNFKGELPLNADFIIKHPVNIETLNVVIPWNRKRFQFTSKQNCLPAAGMAAIGNEIFSFEADGSLASLDFGRGIWPRKTFWNWASASGTHKGKRIGFNLGGTWTNGTGMTENAILYDGRINKISEDAAFIYNHSDIMKPWRINSQNSKRVEIEFSPVYDRKAVTNIALVKSNMHQVFGYFSGRIILDSGKDVNIESLFGCVEEHDSKW